MQGDLALPIPRPAVARGWRQTWESVARLVEPGLFFVFLALLIQPGGVPDPYGVGDELAWPLLCFTLVTPILVLRALRRDALGTPLDLPIAAYVFCVLATWVTAFDAGTTLRAVTELGACLAVFYATTILTRTTARLAPLILVVLVAGIAVLEVSAVLYHLEVGWLTRPTVYLRPEGWSGYPELGQLAAVQFGILLAAFQMGRGVWLSAAIVVLVAVNLVEVGLLYSRLAWVALGAVVVMAAWRDARKRRWRTVATVLALGVVLGAILVTRNPTMKRLGLGLVGRDTSAVATPAVPVYIATADMRLDIWRRTLRMIADVPWTGVGLGNFRAVYETRYNPDVNNDGRRGVHAHSLWLHQTAELGLIGGAAYLILWLAVLRIGWRGAEGLVGCAAFYAIVAVAARSVADNLFAAGGGAQSRLHTLTWLCFGLSAAYVRGSRAASSDAPATES